MIDRAAELALLGCVPMLVPFRPVEWQGRVFGPGAMIANNSGVWCVTYWSGYPTPPAVYRPARWDQIGLEGIPQGVYDMFVREIRP